MNSKVFDKEEYIPVNTRKESARVNVREILYIETQLRVIYIYTSHRVYRFYGKPGCGREIFECKFLSLS